MAQVFYCHHRELVQNIFVVLSISFREEAGTAFIGATVFLGTGRLDGMSNLIPFDVDKWSRREHFHHYRQVVPCTYSMCVELDATDFLEELRKTSWKTYIAQIWAIATIVNRHHEFRMALTEDGQLGVWGEVHPSFTIFNRVQETFSSVWVPYDTDFLCFTQPQLRPFANTVAEPLSSRRGRRRRICLMYRVSRGHPLQVLTSML